MKFNCVYINTCNNNPFKGIYHLVIRLNLSSKPGSDLTPTEGAFLVL